MGTRFKVQPGMTVRNYDGDKLGTVVRVEGDHFVVEKGVFFVRDYTLTADQIDEIADGGICLKWGTRLVEEPAGGSHGGGAERGEQPPSEG